MRHIRHKAHHAALTPPFHHALVRSRIHVFVCIYRSIYLSTDICIHTHHRALILSRPDFHAVPEPLITGARATPITGDTSVTSPMPAGSITWAPVAVMLLEAVL